MPTKSDFFRFPLRPGETVEQREQRYVEYYGERNRLTGHPDPVIAAYRQLAAEQEAPSTETEALTVILAGS